MDEKSLLVAVCKEISLAQGTCRLLASECGFYFDDLWDMLTSPHFCTDVLEGHVDLAMSALHTELDEEDDET